MPSFINNLISLFYREKGRRRSFENRGNPQKIRKKNNFEAALFSFLFFFFFKLPIQSSVFVLSIFGLLISYPSTVSIRSNSSEFGSVSLGSVCGWGRSFEGFLLIPFCELQLWWLCFWLFQLLKLCGYLFVCSDLARRVFGSFWLFSLLDELTRKIPVYNHHGNFNGMLGIRLFYIVIWWIYSVLYFFVYGVDSLLFSAVPRIKLNLEFELVLLLGRIFNGMWFQRHFFFHSSSNYIANSCWSHFYSSRVWIGIFVLTSST